MDRSPGSLSRHNVDRDQSGCLLEDEILSYTFDGFPLFRRANTEDEKFLHTLFVENRSSDLLRLPLAPANLDFLLKMQYQGQRTSYAAQYSNARMFIICSGDGAAVGNMLLALEHNHCRLVDLAVVKSAQRRGWGTRSILACQQACRIRQLPLLLAVSAHNPAKSLYARTGFVERLSCDIKFAGQVFTEAAAPLSIFHELQWTA